MTAKKTVVYDCDVCGTEVTINSEGMGNLSPIYCCGIALTRRKKNKPAGQEKKMAASMKKTAAKTSARASVKAASRDSKRRSSKK